VQVRKAVAMFPPHPDVTASGRGLRVSRYFDPADGPPHTRLSVYDADGRVSCVVALDDAATSDLADFLDGIAGPPSPVPQPGVFERLRGMLGPPR
jgi:hypothetical protein